MMHTWQRTAPQAISRIPTDIDSTHNPYQTGNIHCHGIVAQHGHVHFIFSLLIHSLQPFLAHPPGPVHRSTGPSRENNLRRPPMTRQRPKFFKDKCLAPNSTNVITSEFSHTSSGKNAPLTSRVLTMCSTSASLPSSIRRRETQMSFK